MNEELVITPETFEEHFFDIRKNRPQRGQVLARYTAMADFVESKEKGHVIDLLLHTNKVEAASQVMRKIHHAAEHDSYKVLEAMCKDLMDGMSAQEVLEKPYRYMIEMFYYADPEVVPKEDPHWCTFGLLPHGLLKEESQ